VIEAFNMLAARGRLPAEDAKILMAKYQQKIDDNTAYIKAHGIDMPEIDAWQWNR
jgi:phosphoketolase